MQGLLAASMTTAKAQPFDSAATDKDNFRRPAVNVVAGQAVS
jgi:hypothetical protein